MREMTDKQALEEAMRRWGGEGAIRARARPAGKSEREPGRLARYRCTVGNHGLGKRCSIQGQGDTWREAFVDARPVAGAG